MGSRLRIFLAAAVGLCLLSPISAHAADWVRIVSITPASGEFHPWVRGHAFDASNSFVVTLAYNLESLPSAVVAANITAPHSGVYQVPAPRTRGTGRLSLRVSMMCLDKDPAVLSGLRLRAFIAQPVGVYHFYVDKAIPHTFRCHKGPTLKVPPAGVTPGVTPPGGVVPQLPPAAPCPDPAVVKLAPRITHRDNQWSGTVEIYGVARNLGRGSYHPGRRHQELRLTEQVPGGTARVVASRRFADLAPGQRVTIQFRRHWNSASPAEGEFPPTYTLAIVYNPAISKGARGANRDCRLDNNEKTMNGSQINRLFRSH